MIVVPDEGERFLLRMLLIEDIGEEDVFICGLYRNDPDIDRYLVLSDIVEANFAGYAPLVLDRDDWTDPVTVENRAQSTYTTMYHQWNTTSGEQQIFGWYVRDADSNVCLWAERFQTPIMVSPTVPVILLPVIRLRSEFEPLP